MGASGRGSRWTRSVGASRARFLAQLDLFTLVHLRRKLYAMFSVSAGLILVIFPAPGPHQHERVQYLFLSLKQIRLGLVPVERFTTCSYFLRYRFFFSANVTSEANIRLYISSTVVLYFASRGSLHGEKLGVWPSARFLARSPPPRQEHRPARRPTEPQRTLRLLLDLLRRRRRARSARRRERSSRRSRRKRRRRTLRLGNRSQGTGTAGP